MSTRQIMSVLGVIAVAIIWGANGFHYFVWALLWSVNLLPGNPYAAIGALAGAAFLAGPIVILLMKRSAGGVPWTGMPLGAAVLLAALSATVAAILASSAVVGAFSEIGRTGYADPDRLLPPFVLAAGSVQFALFASTAVLLVLAVLSLRGVTKAGGPLADARPRMSLMQSVGLAGVVVAGLIAVDRLLVNYLSAMDFMVALLGPPKEGGPTGLEMGRSEEMLTVFGAGVMLTLCLLVFGIGLWRASRRYAPTTLFTWTSRAALVVALAGSVWHSVATFETARDVDRMVEWVDTMRKAPPPPRAP